MLLVRASQHGAWERAEALTEPGGRSARNAHDRPRNVFILRWDMASHIGPDGR